MKTKDARCINHFVIACSQVFDARADTISNQPLRFSLQGLDDGRHFNQHVLPQFPQTTSPPVYIVSQRFQMLICDGSKMQLSP